MFIKLLKFLFIILILFFSCYNETVVLGVKSINFPFKKVQRYLPLFQEKGVGLYLQIDESDLESPDLKTVLKDAQNKEIKTTIWPLLPIDDGPWANEMNYEKFGKLLDKVTNWLEKEQLHPEWIVINMENSDAQMKFIRKCFHQQHYDKLINLLLSNIDPEHFAKAVQAYKEIVKGLQKKGYKVMITTYPFLLDDFKDKDPDIQDLTNVPIAGIPWDAFTFTTYRTAYSGDFGVKFTPFIVFEYARLAKKYFGKKARISLGIIGSSSHGFGFESPADLAKDIAAAKAIGIDEVDLFHLKGMVNEGGPFAWIDSAINVMPEMPEPDLKVVAARGFVLILDEFLNKGEHEKIMAALKNLIKDMKR